MRHFRQMGHEWSPLVTTYSCLMSLSLRRVVALKQEVILSAADPEQLERGVDFIRRGEAAR